MDVVAWLEATSVNYKGVDYTVVKTATVDVWKWQFQIGNVMRTGNTETKIEFLARRRAQIHINRALKLLLQH
jgi:hypothetical protein